MKCRSKVPVAGIVTVKPVPWMIVPSEPTVPRIMRSLSSAAGAWYCPVPPKRMSPQTSSLAAGAAVNEVLGQGRYKLEGVRRHPYRVRLDRLTDVPRYIQAIGEPKPRFVAGTRARLRQLWRGRTTNTRIEVTDGMVISLLRKR